MTHVIDLYDATLLGMDAGVVATLDDHQLWVRLVSMEEAQAMAHEEYPNVRLVIHEDDEAAA